MLEGSESPRSPHKLVQPENVSISTFYMVILDEMDLKVAKLVNFAQIWTCRPLTWPIIHQQATLEGPESPKSPHKLVQPENVSISAFYMVILVVQGANLLSASVFRNLVPPPFYPHSGPL